MDIVNKEVLEYMIGEISKAENVYTDDGKDVNAKLKDVDGLLEKSETITNLEQNVEDLNTTVSDIDEKVNPFNISISSNLNVAEMGQVVTTLQLSWKFNKPIRSHTFDDETMDPMIRSKSIIESITDNRTFTVSAVDKNRKTHSKSFTLTFENGIYYGKSSSTVYDDKLIKSLQNKVLSGSRARSITVNAGEGEYIYYAIPSRLGTASFNVGGFDGGLEKVSTIMFTNSNRYSEQYDIYRSDNPNLGNTTVNIK